MSFAKRQPRPPKVYEGANPAKPRASAPATWSAALEFGTESNTPPRPFFKVGAEDEALGRRIRESARGEQCTVRLVGVCTHDPATVIWSHARWGAQLGGAGRGMATKALDLAGAYACTSCDAAYDGQTRVAHLTRDEIDRDWMMGHLRSLGRLVDKGII